MNPRDAAQVRDAAARARLAANEAASRRAREAAETARQERAAGTEERRLAAALVDADSTEVEAKGRLEAEQAGRGPRTAPYGVVGEQATRAFGAWAAKHTGADPPHDRPAGAARPMDAGGRLARACEGCEVADGFDLAEHLQRIAAEVARARRIS